MYLLTYYETSPINFEDVQGGRHEKNNISHKHIVLFGSINNKFVR